MARRAFLPSDYALPLPGHGRLHFLQHFVGPFLHHLHLRSIPRGATIFFKEALIHLQHDVDAYSGAPESQKQEETRTAERLVQAVSSYVPSQLFLPEKSHSFRSVCPFTALHAPRPTLQQ